MFGLKFNNLMGAGKKRKRRGGRSKKGGSVLSKLKSLGSRVMNTLKSAYDWGQRVKPVSRAVKYFPSLGSN